MKKIKHKVNVDNIPEEFKGVVKSEMTNAEVGVLGVVVLKYKISMFKEKMRNKLCRKNIKK